MDNIKVIFWDFDGVLLDSNLIREVGFERVLSDFPKDEVEKLLIFHRENGGLSRYVKFKYFFQEIRGENILEEDVIFWANEFSKIMKNLLIDPKLLIKETIDFVKQNQGKYKMHITSGSDQDELRYLCKCLNIDQYFDSIHGSPKPKIEWVKDILNTYKYNKTECILIGDSFNDLEAANLNNVHFFGYNNLELVQFSTIKNFFE